METDLIPERLETDTIAQDRRRPGRGADVSSELIPLLHGTGGASDDLIEPVEKSDPLSMARGVKVAAGFSAIFWAAISLGLWIYIEP